MKLRLPLYLSALIATAPGLCIAADQAQALKLAERKGCFECHAIAWQLTGPAFSDVAARYRDDGSARDRLVEKLRYGGSQHWGDRADMAPQTNLSDEEAYELVDWVLQQ